VGTPKGTSLLGDPPSEPAPNQVLAGDITYIPTTDGWLPLAVLLDLYSRRVVGWPCRTASTRSWPSLRCGWPPPRGLWRPTGFITRTGIADTVATTTSPRWSSLRPSKALRLSPVRPRPKDAAADHLGARHGSAQEHERSLLHRHRGPHAPRIAGEPLGGANPTPGSASVRRLRVHNRSAHRG
jgi:hypothetical protein